MMGKNYTKKTNRSRRKLHKLPDDAVQVDIAGGTATFQMVLPMNELMAEVADAIEETASQAGLLMMKAMIDDEVNQLVGPRYAHDQERQRFRWGKEEGHVIFAGRKAAIEKPRVRSKDGREIPLRRYTAFGNPRRMEQAVQRRVLRRVSMRDYEGVIDDICDGYGIDKSSVSRQWKSASGRQLKQMLERPLGDLDICVIMLDGKEFHDYTLITALGVDSEGHKHVLGLWPGATENADVCGRLLDDLIERGLAQGREYLFVLDGSKALKKAVVKRFGNRTLIQRCRLHKERNIRSYLPKKYHKLLGMKLRAAWGMTRHEDALTELLKVRDWLAEISQAAASSLEEGLEETLTVNRLSLPEELRGVFASTNMIESCFSLTGDLCGNVKRWRNANMAWRWGGAVLLEAEKRFHRVKHYRQMPLLPKGLKELVDSQQAVA